MSDDSQGIRETLQLVGRAVMTTLTVPESHGLLKPECPIRDISLVLGRLIEIVMDWSGSSEQEEFSWVKEMIAKAKENGIVIAGAPFGVEKHVEKFEDLD